MDAFEQVVAMVLDRDGYWVRTSVKVALTKEEKQQIGRPTAPRWELDIVAYSGERNELLVVECKSYLDSAGVQLASFEEPLAAVATRYKLFADDTLRQIVMRRLEIELTEQRFCPPGVQATLCLAAGNIHRDAEALERIFAEKGWRLFGPAWLIERLQKIAAESYDDSAAAIVAKLLVRGERRRGRGSRA